MRKTHRSSRKIILIIAAILLVLIAAAVTIFLLQKPSSAPASKGTPEPTAQPATTPTPPPAKGYTGETVNVGDAFSVKAPNGWQASVSTSQTFLAIIFSRPNKLDTLVYNPDIPAAVDYNGIPAWSGLTEHLYIRALTKPTQAFNPASHQEITSEPSFTFDDGIVGTKYFVTKHAEEATQYGGLLKDTVWYGRTYVYQKEGMTLEAHLGLYPSSKYDIGFYEKVIKTLSIKISD